MVLPGLGARSSEARGDARNQFQGSLGNERRWEGEVGGFRRNNDGEGSREQGGVGEAGSRGVVEDKGGAL
jgi:hypothetical protein